MTEKYYHNGKEIHFDEGTPDEVKRILVNLLNVSFFGRKRIRIFYGDTQTGRDWHEEWMNIGYIGISTGTKPILLLVNNARSLGGPAISTSSIVKMTSGYTLYQHPNYHHGTHTIQPSDLPEYKESVYRDGELVARFKKAGQAQRWIDYIEGRRNNH